MALNNMAFYSQEMISFQKDPEVFLNITKCLKNIRDSKHRFTNSNAKSDLKIIAESGIAQYLMKRMGFNLSMTVRSNIGTNAYMMPPDLDKNHPLIQDYHRDYYKNADVKKRISKAKDGLKGTIDVRNAKLSGVYSEIPVLICMSTQILMDDFFTIEEAAGIFSHELGHAFTYFEYLGRTLMISPIMADIAAELNETKSFQHRVEILGITKESLDLNEMEPDALAKVTNTETIQTLIISEVVQQTNHATNTPWYDLRTYEILSDQFVIRIGGGGHLGKGLDKLYRSFGVAPYQTQVQWVTTQVFTALIGVIFSPLLILLMTFSTPTQIYDDPIQRVSRLKSDMVNALKNIKNDKAFNERMLKEIAIIEDLVRDVRDRDDVIMWVWKNVFSKTRKQVSKADAIMELEKLSNNDLYLASAKLRSF